MAVQLFREVQAAKNFDFCRKGGLEEDTVLNEGTVCRTGRDGERRAKDTVSSIYVWYPAVRVIRPAGRNACAAAKVDRLFPLRMILHERQ